MSELNNQAKRILELSRVLLSLKVGTSEYDLAMGRLEAAVNELQRLLATKH